MNDIARYIDHAEDNCRATGARLTNRRKRVLVSLMELQRGLSVHTLASYWNVQLDEAIKPMSGYRILDNLENENLVHKLSLNNKYISHIDFPHTHDVSQFHICDGCGSVKEINIRNSLIEKLQTSVDQSASILKCHRPELYGLCQESSDKRRAEHDQ